MGSLANGDGGSKPNQKNSLDDNDDGETQSFDTQTSTPSVSEEFETQVVDLAGETQVMDFGGETQVVNFGGETQLLDDFNCIEDMETQLLDVFDYEDFRESDDEGTDSTQVLGDENDISDDDDDELVRKGDGQSVEKEKGQCSYVSKYSEKGIIEQTDASNDEQNNSGLHVPTATEPMSQASIEPKPGCLSMRFTSVRTASLRASGLAARNKRTNSVPSSITTSSSLEKVDVFGTVVFRKKLGKEGEQEQDLGRCNEIINGSRNDSMCRVGSLAARKLFTEDLDCENKDDTSQVNGGEDLIQLPSCDLAGLSYVDSQEPGELSQANALDVVDRFLKENAEEFDNEIDCAKSTGEKSIDVLSLKGPQILAKKANGTSIVEEFDVYDWDDNREDEGGGDIFRRRKEEFFGVGSLDRRPRKLGVKGLQEQKNCKKQFDGSKSSDRRMHVFNSDSKLLLRNLRVNEKPVNKAERMFKRNLINELDKQSDIDFHDKHLEKNATKTDMPERLDVGFDTQMAAEAMEALLCGEDPANCDVNGACRGAKKNSGSDKGPKQLLSRKRACVNDIGVALKQTKKSRRVGTILNKVSSVSSEKQSNNMREQSEADLVMKKSKKAKGNASGKLNTYGSENLEKISGENIKKQKAQYSKRGIEELDSDHCAETLSGGFSVNKQHGQEKVGSLEPIAHRTRRSMAESHFKNVGNEFSDCREEMNNLTDFVAVNEKRNNTRGVQASKMLTSRNAQLSKIETINANVREEFAKNEALMNSNEIGALICPRGRRSSRILSCQLKKSGNVDDSHVPSVQPEVGETTFTHKSSCRETRSFICDQPGMSSIGQDFEGKMLQGRLDRVVAGNAESGQTSSGLGESPREKSKLSYSSCTTPLNCKVSISDISPLCVGNEYFKQSCKRSPSKPSLLKEIRSLSATGSQPASASKDLRKRREMTNVQVLYSQHLDDNIIKQQKKILARLGVSVASSISDATHFIADQFVRTRNMLEAIASCKPVVTHLWLENCGQANCFIDEKRYILRDSKKEKEFGFSMPATLACASQHPLLQGLRVLVTPNTKPGTEIISSLVKAVQGQAVERIGRFAVKDDVFPDNLLVLSCEEDYAICVPFLEKGAAIYSSELLLNGIVTQKLEYERYQLFTDHVRKTRSTIWLKKDGSKFLPVTKRRKG